VKQATRPAIFKWRQTAPELILCAVRWYLRYSLSLRDVEELFAERGLAADHTTIWRWVQRYGPALEQRLRGQLKSTNKSWRVDETYIRVKGRWCGVPSLPMRPGFLLCRSRTSPREKLISQYSMPQKPTSSSTPAKSQKRIAACATSSPGWHETSRA
jgi:transposase, IS6 family